MSGFVDIMEDQKKDARIAELEETKALLDLAMSLFPKDAQVTYSLTTSSDSGDEKGTP